MINHIVHPFVLMRSGPKARGVMMSSVMELNDLPITGEARTDLNEAERRLMTCGFGPAAYAISRAIERATTCVALLNHIEDAASGAILAADHPTHPKRPTTRFATDFVDGVRIITANSATTVRTPTPPRIDGATFAHVNAVDELYSIHRMRVAARARSTPVSRMNPGLDPIQVADAEARDIQDHWVKRGYYRYIDGDRMRLTARGAALSAWRGLFPWALIAAVRRDRKTRDVCARLGLRMPPGS
jgi:hypothetical protein